MSVRRMLYSFVIYLIFPIVILRLFWRSRSNSAYKERILERLGFFSIPTQLPIIWVHVVSVGETIAAKPLIESLILQYPQHRVLVTSTTPTGSKQVTSLFSDRVSHVYFPYDLPEIIYRFLNRVQPKIAIIVETEIWPNLYAACYKRDIPLLIVNARLSPRSTKSYMKIKPLLVETLGKVSLIAVRSEADKENFLKIGAIEDKLIVTGNIKFDIEVDHKQQEIGRLRKVEWGNERPVWVAASTHKGEDEQIVSLHKRLLKTFPTLLLIIIPRHPERFDDVYQLCSNESVLETLRHSEQKNYQKAGEVNIIVGDSMGEMQSWFVAADVVFMGGSLVETGGHNPLEATVQGVPVVSGFHMFNFEDISAELTKANLLFICKTMNDLESKMKQLLKIDHKDFMLKAEKTMQQHKGVTARLCDHIASRLL